MKEVEFAKKELNMTQMLKIIVMVFIIVGLLIIHKDYLYRLWTQKKPGTIIVLNGTSSTG